MAIHVGHSGRIGHGRVGEWVAERGAAAGGRWWRWGGSLGLEFLGEPIHMRVRGGEGLGVGERLPDRGLGPGQFGADPGQVGLGAAWHRAHRAGLPGGGPGPPRRPGRRRGPRAPACACQHPRDLPQPVRRGQAAPGAYAAARPRVQHRRIWFGCSKCRAAPRRGLQHDREERREYGQRQRGQGEPSQGDDRVRKPRPGTRPIRDMRSPHRHLKCHNWPLAVQPAPPSCGGEPARRPIARSGAAGTRTSVASFPNHAASV